MSVDDRMRYLIDQRLDELQQEVARLTGMVAALSRQVAQLEAIPRVRARKTED